MSKTGWRQLAALIGSRKFWRNLSRPPNSSARCALSSIARQTPPRVGRTMARQREARVLVTADWAPIRAFDPIIRENPKSIYGDLLPALRRADLRIVNCECALTRSSHAVWKSGAVFKGDPAHVGGLTAVPFDIACLANNHVLDYGTRGLAETLAVLKRRKIRTVGAGLSEK